MDSLEAMDKFPEMWNLPKLIKKKWNYQLITDQLSVMKLS